MKQDKVDNNTSLLELNQELENVENQLRKQKLDKVTYQKKKRQELENKINEDFGSTENMKEAFINAGIGQFGSGWCWLVLNNGKLEITKTPNAEKVKTDTSIPSGKVSFNVFDV